jgi:hypothetical protein
MTQSKNKVGRPKILPTDSKDRTINCTAEQLKRFYAVRDANPETVAQIDATLQQTNKGTRK